MLVARATQGLEGEAQGRTGPKRHGLPSRPAVGSGAADEVELQAAIGTGPREV